VNQGQKGQESMTKFTYDYRNRVVKTVLPQTNQKNKILTYGYNGLNHITSETISDGNETYAIIHQYDGLGRKTQTINPNGHITRYLYDEAGNLIKEVDGRYASQSVEEAPGKLYTYDKRDRLIEEAIFEDGEIKILAVYTYDGRGNIVKQVNSLGYNYQNPSQSVGETMTYNAINQIATYQTAENNLQNVKTPYTYAYDGSGRILESRNPLGHTSRTEYDLLGQIITVYYPDQSTTQFTYDLSGRRRIEMTDALGYKTITIQNQWGKVEEQINPDQSRIKISYTVDGKVKEQNHSVGSQTLYTYDLAGNVITEKTLQDETTTEKIYKLTNYAYDIRSLLTETTVYELIQNKATHQENLSSIQQKITYTYDKNGNLIAIQGPGQRETRYEYDPKGQILASKQRVDGANWSVVRKTYNLLGNVIEKSQLVDSNSLDADSLTNAQFDHEYGAKVLVTFGYDYNLAGLLTKTIDPMGNVTEHSYNLSGQVTSTINPLGAKTIYAYDPLEQLVEQISPLGAISSYTYDSKGNMIKKSVPYGDGQKVIYLYEYDKKDQLIKEILPEGVATHQGMSYVYDSRGNIIEIYNTENQLIETRSYDGKGRLINTVDGLRKQNQGTTYTYNYMDQIKSSTNPLGHKTTMTYDIFGNILTTTNAKNHTTRYTYNKDQTLAQVEYPDGGKIKYGYDGLGRLIETKDSLGYVKQYSYNDFGQIQWEKDPMGYETHYIYDLKGQITESIDKIGSKTLYSYDALGQVLNIQRPMEERNGQIIYSMEENRYDQEGRLINQTIYEKTTQNNLRSVSYTYYDDGQVKTQTASTGERITYTYNQNANLIKQIMAYTDGNKQIQTFTYDLHNLLIEQINYIDEKAIKDADTLPDTLKNPTYPGTIQSITRYTYDLLGNVIQQELPQAFQYDVQNPERKAYITSYKYDVMNQLVTTTYTYEGRVYEETITYDAVGNKIAIEDAKGHIRTLEYDAMNRLIKTTDPEGNSMTYDYDLVGNKTKETNAKGQSMTYEYDGLQRLVTLTDAYGVKVEKRTYDPKGNLLTFKDALGYTTTYTYDFANRLVTITDPETQTQGGAFTQKNTYDIYGNVLTVTDALGAVTTYTYDQRGLLLTMTDPLGSTTTYTYDAMGNKISRIDGSGRETKYGYSHNGHLLSVTNPLGQQISYTYDLADNLVEEIDKKGQTILYTYDSFSRLTKKENQDTQEAIHYTYDILNNRTEMKDSTGTTLYSYNKNNQLLRRIKDGKEEIVYTYDVLGNRATVTTNGYTVRYGYDKSNRMETIDYNGAVSTYTYDQRGNRKTLTYSNGVTITYSYDRNGQVTGILNKRGNHTYSELSYTYDLTGKITSKKNHLGMTHYTYDLAGRLIKEIAPGYTTVYTYDKKGNRLISETIYKDLQNTSFIYTDTEEIAKYKIKKTYYIYNEGDQLIKSTEKMIDDKDIEILTKTTAYIYDLNGNQTSQYSNYTHPHRLMMRQKVQVETLSEVPTQDESLSTLIDRTVYTYDGFNQLISVEKIADGSRTLTSYAYDGEGLRITKTEKTSEEEKVIHYTYDRQHVIIEEDGKGQTTFYLRGINYLGMEREDEITYYLYNGHGDVIHTVDETGTVKNQYAYDAFGNPTFTLEVEENPIRYGGEFYDASTGLYYLRARYYNPYTGRFISEDSYWGEEANPLSLNLYTYCHNDPVNYVDPSGHFALGIIGGIVAGIGAIVSSGSSSSSSGSGSSSSSSVVPNSIISNGTIVDTKNGPVIDYSSGGGDSYSSSSNSSSESSSSNSSSSSYQSPAIKLIGTAIDTLYGTAIDYIYGNGKNSFSYATKINSLEKETNDKELLTASPINFFEKIMPLVRINIGDESTILGTYIDGTLVTEVNSLAKGLGGEVNGSVFKQTVTIDGKTIVYNINYVLNGKGKRW
jgi:RHS repeat-associated protein